MFERFYLWMMRHGSRTLFIIALLTLVGTWILYGVGIGAAGDGSLDGFGTSRSPASWLLSWAAPFLTSLQVAALPLFGALVIDRLDRSHRNPG